MNQYSNYSIFFKFQHKIITLISHGSTHPGYSTNKITTPYGRPVLSKSYQILTFDPNITNESKRKDHILVNVT